MCAQHSPGNALYFQIQKGRAHPRLCDVALPGAPPKHTLFATIVLDVYNTHTTPPHTGVPLQYLEPAVSNAMKPLSESDWVRVMERVLKLALPNLYAWLVS